MPGAQELTARCEAGEREPATGGPCSDAELFQRPACSQEALDTRAARVGGIS